MNRKAFTLIEMIVVLAIIGLIGIMVLPNVNKAVVSSRMRECEGYSSVLQEQLRLYYSDYRNGIDEILKSSSVVGVQYNDIKYNGDSDSDLDKKIKKGDIVIDELQITKSSDGVVGYLAEFKCNGFTCTNGDCK